MGCNCKSGGNNLNEDIKEKGGKNIILGYIKRFILFSLTLLILPIILVVIINIMFKTIVLDRDLNIKEILNGLIKVMKKANTNYEEEDDENDFYDLEDLTEDDVELEEVEDLTKEFTNVK